MQKRDVIAVIEQGVQVRLTARWFELHQGYVIEVHGKSDTTPVQTQRGEVRTFKTADTAITFAESCGIYEMHFNF